jgi:kinesin family protein C1
MSQANLQALLQSTQNTEREARRDLTNASEEIAALRTAHLREVDDLERQVARKDREKRGLEEELRDSRDELSRERETVRGLKVGQDPPLRRILLIGSQTTLAEQSTQHMTLSAQLTAAQTQNAMLQTEIERATLAVSAMKAELEVGRQKALEAEQKVADAEAERDRRIAEIEDELRAAETIRRKLHNQVQELKGECTRSAVLTDRQYPRVCASPTSPA